LSIAILLFTALNKLAEFNSNGNGYDGEQTVGGRAIKVNFPEVPKVGKRVQMGSNYRGYVDSPHKIYAGNLGWDMTSKHLREAFAEQPGLLSAKVVYERNNGKSRGYGFVSFKTAEDVEVALSAMNGVVWMNNFFSLLVLQILFL